LEVTGGLGRADLVTWAQTFLLEVRRLTGRVPMLYTYPYFWSASLGDPVGLARWPLWMASYSGPVNVGATLWQYTSTAHVDGIRGGVDMSRLTADPSMWSALSDGRTATPWPAAAPGAPQAVVAHPGDAQVVVSWLPGDTGSSDVTSYWVTASPGGAHAVVGGTAHQATISGLTNGTAYTFTVVASNKVGAGEASPATAAVTPLVPTRLSVQPSAPLTYGDDVVVSARLLQSDTGRSLAGRTVTASVRALGGGAWTALPDRVTTKHGWVALHLGPAVTSQVVRLSFAGPAGWHSSSTTVDLVAHRKVSGWLSRSRVRVGRAVTLQGRVTPALEGLVVRRQRLEGGVWRTTATTTVDAAGRYSFALVFRRRTTARLRVVVPAKAGLGAGVSPTRTLTAH
ncbi:MAG: fibronectin type III domain-containing protein, partial [Frankiales bacterium]|nr:fibronectin type III domain-containing protein [Frankiales bacterium]